jgi:parallel beta-helix repeat protein
MNGFGVIRVGTGTTNSSLVRSGGVSFSNIVVKNGTVKNSGKHAIELWGNSRVENVRVIKPLGVGIMMNGPRNVVADCVIDDPTQDAVLVGDDALVMNTSVFSPGTYGIVTGANSEVRSSRVLAAGQNGIQAGIGTLVQNCTVANCTAFGISGTFGATALRIMDNTVTNNGSGGIRVYSTSQVVGNTVSVSGLQVPGITVTFDGNRIEANLIHGGPDAVRIDASGDGNLVVRNQAFAPTNGNGFANVNAAGNQIGPVVTAAGSISSTSPHANFSR